MDFPADHLGPRSSDFDRLACCGRTASTRIARESEHDYETLSFPPQVLPHRQAFKKKEKDNNKQKQTKLTTTQDNHKQKTKLTTTHKTKKHLLNIRSFGKPFLRCFSPPGGEIRTQCTETKRSIQLFYFFEHKQKFLCRLLSFSKIWECDFRPFRFSWWLPVRSGGQSD